MGSCRCPVVRRQRGISNWLFIVFLDILWRQVCVSTDNDKTIFNLFFTITKPENIQKQGKSLKEKLFQAHAGSVRERFVIQCLYSYWQRLRTNQITHNAPNILIFRSGQNFYKRQYIDIIRYIMGAPLHRMSPCRDSNHIQNMTTTTWHT